jgi:hypothetical protein
MPLPEQDRFGPRQRRQRGWKMGQRETVETLKAVDLGHG